MDSIGKYGKFYRLLEYHLEALNRRMVIFGRFSKYENGHFWPFSNSENGHGDQVTFWPFSKSENGHFWPFSKSENDYFLAIEKDLKLQIYF